MTSCSFSRNGAVKTRSVSRQAASCPFDWIREIARQGAARSPLGRGGASICDMTEASEQLLRAWRAAADDLGIRVEVEGEVVHVTEFGSPEGMLCALRDSQEGQLELRHTAEARGAGWSVLSLSYVQYDRDGFIDVLNDWGWCALGDPPAWYTGEPWFE